MQILSRFPAVVAVGIFGTVQGYELKPQLHARLSFPSFPNLHVFFFNTTQIPLRMRLSTACVSAIFMSEGATSLKVMLEHLQPPCHHMSVAALQ